MSAFTNGFNFGFVSGMFNRMFGGFSPFGGVNPFFCGCNSFFGGFNPMPMFFTPTMNMSVFTSYQMPTVNFNFPSYQMSNTAFDFSNVGMNYSSPTLTMMDSYTPSYNISNTSKTKNETKNVIHKTKTPVATTYREMTDTQMREVYGNYTRNATTLYKGTAADLNKYLKGKGVLEGQGQAFIDAQNKYGISASILAGICMNETAGGTSNLAVNKHNVGGVRKPNSKEFKTFSSVEACIDEMASLLKRRYINENLVCLYQINAKYCPASDPTDKTGNNSKWARAVDKFATEIERV